MSWFDTGVDIAVEFAWDDAPFAVSPTWTDETAYVRSMVVQSTSRGNEFDAFQPGTLSLTLDNRSRRFDPAWGPASVDVSSAGYFGAGDLAAFAGASALDVRAAISCNAWAGGGVQSVVSQFGAAGQRAWALAVDDDGYLLLITSADGTATTSTDSGCRVGAVAGQIMCVRATWDQASGDVEFFVKRTTAARARLDCLSHDDWLQLGATAAGSTSVLHNSTAAVRVGVPADSSTQLNGSVYYADARTTIGSDTLVFGFWPADAADESDTSWASSAGAGETWTGGGTWTLAVQGPMFGRLTPGIPVRVSATYSATTYRLFTGYVRRWPQTYPSQGLDAVVQVSAVDALGWLAGMPAPATPFGVAMEIVRAGLLADPDIGVAGSYWPLHEPFPGLEVSDVWGGCDGAWSAAATAGAPSQPASMAPTRLLGSWFMSAPGLVRLPSDVAAYPQLAFWVHLPDAAATFRVQAVGEFPNGDRVAIRINYGVGGSYYVQADWGASGSWSRTILGRLAAGSHHLRIISNIATAGYVLDERDDSAFEVGPLGSVVVSGTTEAGGLYIDGTNATVSDVTFGPDWGVTPISAGRNGRALDASGDRAKWLLDAARVPSGLQSMTADPTTFLGASTAGGTYGALLRQVEAAEAGRLFVAGDGVVTLLSRVWATTATAATTSQGTFSDTPGDGSHYSALVIDPANIDDLINSATVSIASGAVGSHRHEDSIAAYGESSRQVVAPLASAGDAANLARHYVDGNAWPRTRVEGLTILPRSPSQTAATVWPQVLGRAIGERITVKRRPTDTLTGGSVTTPIVADVTIEGIRHAVSAAGVWETTWTTAPAPPTAQEAGHFTADDAVLGVVDAGIVVPY